MIPFRLIRSVPERTSEEVERFWQIACDLHPGWEMVTHRDPIDTTRFPITAPVWDRCQNGAQLAGLIRLEALLDGGIYLDSDVVLLKPLTPLVDVRAFAAWEDANVVPDAVIGAEPHHPAIKECLNLALSRIQSDSQDWKTGRGAWSTGPGVTTEVLPNRDDVLLLSPDSFYPVHYSQKDAIPKLHPKPWTFGIHHWAASWL